MQKTSSHTGIAVVQDVGNPNMGGSATKLGSFIMPAVWMIRMLRDCIHSTAVSRFRFMRMTVASLLFSSMLLF